MKRRGLYLSERSVKRSGTRRAPDLAVFLGRSNGSGRIGKGRFVFGQNDFEKQDQMKYEKQTVADPCRRLRYQQRDPVHIAAAEKAA